MTNQQQLGQLIALRKMLLARQVKSVAGVMLLLNQLTSTLEARCETERHNQGRKDSGCENTIGIVTRSHGARILEGK